MSKGVVYKSIAIARANSASKLVTLKKVALGHGTVSHSSTGRFVVSLKASKIASTKK